MSNGSTDPTQRNATQRSATLGFGNSCICWGLATAAFHQTPSGPDRARPRPSPPDLLVFLTPTAEQRLLSPASCWERSAPAGAFRHPPTSGSSWSSVGLGCPPRKPGKRRFSWEPEGTDPGRGCEGGKIMACGSVKPLTKLQGLRFFFPFFLLSKQYGRGGRGGRGSGGV